MQNILILLDQIDHLRFFSRFERGLREAGYKPIYMALRPTIFALARLAGSAVLLSDVGNRPLVQRPPLPSIDVKIGMQSEQQASRLAGRVREAVGILVERYKAVQVWVWNGGSTSAKATADAARQLGIVTRFFELANIPGKMQVDPVGVNADSTVARQPELLDGVAGAPSDHDFDRWLAEFAEAKRQPLPQAAAVKKINFFYPLDHFAWATGMGLRDDYRSLWHKANRPLSKHRITCPGVLAQLNVPYVFLPLQKSNDTQIQLKSAVDNVGAVKLGLQLAAKKDFLLYVKPHPAEEDPQFPAKVRQVIDDAGDRILIVSNPATDLLINAAEIITINSTVGLEAILFGKKVTFLGKSQYAHMNLARAKAYVFHYLSGIDYFSSQELSTPQVTRALEGPFPRAVSKILARSAPERGNTNSKDVFASPSQ